MCGGSVALDCGISLTVSCCLRQPRITSGATLFLSHLFGVRRGFAVRDLTGANALRLIEFSDVTDSY